jgi:hypothetical protein
MEKCIRTENAFRAFRNNGRARCQAAVQDTLQNRAKVHPNLSVLSGRCVLLCDDRGRYSALNTRDVRRSRDSRKPQYDPCISRSYWDKVCPFQAVIGGGAR